MPDWLQRMLLDGHFLVDHFAIVLQTSSTPSCSHYNRTSGHFNKAGVWFCWGLNSSTLSYTFTKLFIAVEFHLVINRVIGDVLFLTFCLYFNMKNYVKYSQNCQIRTQISLTTKQTSLVLVQLLLFIHVYKYVQRMDISESIVCGPFVTINNQKFLAEIVWHNFSMCNLLLCNTISS